MPGIKPPPDLARREVRRALRIGLLYVTITSAITCLLILKGIRI